MNYLVQHWSFDPAIAVVAVVIVVHELGLANLRRRSSPERIRTRRLRSFFFYGGLALALAAVSSPIEYWTNRYFFVHVIEHILIGFFASILIVAGAPWLPLLFGIPVGPRRRLLRSLLLGRASRTVHGVARFLRNPWTALVSFNAVMVLWHVPILFDVAQPNRAVHVGLMDASLLITGILFWLQIIPSHPCRLRASPLWQIGAIISTNVVMFVMAMTLSLFSQTSWYTVYAHQSGVGLAPFADQQIGAAILWVCGDFWAVPALAVAIRRAIDAKEGFSLGIDRLFHLGPDPSIDALRARGPSTSGATDGTERV